MGIDGFSMSNLGLQRNMTSAQLANEAEVTARQSLENQIADVDGVGKREKVGKKDEDAAFNGMVPFIPNDENNNESPNEGGENKNQQPPVDYSALVDDEEVDKYHFRFNANDMIEIWDTETNEIIKTISPDMARKVIGNIEELPGVLVNRKI